MARQGASLAEAAAALPVAQVVALRADSPVEALAATQVARRQAGARVEPLPEEAPGAPAVVLLAAMRAVLQEAPSRVAASAVGPQVEPRPYAQRAAPSTRHVSRAARVVAARS